MLKEMFDLTGKTALVTGSARGIGRAIALGLAEFGAHVIVHGSRESGPLDEALELARKFDPKAEKVAADLSDPEQIERVLGPVAAGVDILVSNASIQDRHHWSEFPLDEARKEMQVNYFAALRLFQLAYPKMKAQGWGRIITVGSVQELRPHPEMCAYASTKSAQENLVRNVGRQVAKEGITVNNIAPGAFATDRNAEALSNPVYYERVLNVIPMHSVGDPADAAGAAVLLASEAGRYITGATIMVDGGMCLPG